MKTINMNYEERIDIVAKMLERQDTLNRRIHPQWRQKGFNWRRAIWMEAAELMDCFSWKWWTDQNRQTDWENVQIELADLYHFVLSLMLEAGISAAELQKDWEQAPGDVDVLQQIDHLAHLATDIFFVVDERHLHYAFVMLAKALGFDLESLARVYFGKCVLNRFRQERGIKEGRYRKVWGGLEDNRVMLRAAREIPLEPLEEFEKELWRRLEEAYENKVNNGG